MEAHLLVCGLNIVGWPSSMDEKKSETSLLPFAAGVGALLEDASLLVPADATLGEVADNVFDSLVFAATTGQQAPR